MGPRSVERGNGIGARATELLHDASMGPRSVERGNAGDFPNLLSGWSRLQWGRVRLNAETGDSGDCRKIRKNASMGPRSVERGNGHITGVIAGFLFCFNGAAFG